MLSAQDFLPFKTHLSSSFEGIMREHWIHGESYLNVSDWSQHSTRQFPLLKLSNGPKFMDVVQSLEFQTFFGWSFVALYGFINYTRINTKNSYYSGPFTTESSTFEVRDWSSRCNGMLASSSLRNLELRKSTWVSEENFYSYSVK